MIRRLDRYILGTYLGPLLLSLVFAVGMYVIVEIAGKFDRYLKQDSTGELALLLFNYYLCRLPLLLPRVTAAMSLMAGAIAIIRLSRSNELMAMKALGQNLQRIILPILVGAFIVSAAVVAMEEVTLPLLSSRIQHLHNRLRGSGGPQPHIYTNLFVSDARGNLLYVAKYDSREQSFEDAELSEAIENETFAGPPIFELGHYDHASGQWIVKGYRERITADGMRREKVPLTTLDIDLTPEDLIERRFDPDLRSTKELLQRSKLMGRYVRRLTGRRERVMGSMQRRLWGRVHGRAALPFASVALLLVGLPFILHDGNRSSMLGVGIAVLVCVAFYGMQMMAMDLASRESLALPPWVAGWGSTLLFGVVGLYNFRRAGS